MIAQQYKQFRLLLFLLFFQVEVVSKDFAIHEEYDSVYLTNDIAYIRFPNPVTFSKYI